MTAWNSGYGVDELSELLDPDMCPNVALAMGLPGLLQGYPLFKPIEPMGELDRIPEEPVFDYDDYDDYEEE